MQKVLTVLSLLLLIFSQADAQKQKKEKEINLDYGKIPASDLAMTVYPLDSSAEAVVLSEKGKYAIEYFDGEGDEFVYTNFRRLKLFKKSAFNNEGTIRVTYYSKNKKSRLNYIKAAVVRPSGARYELTEKEFLEEKTTTDFTTLKFAFPNLTEGCIIEYEYQIIKNNLAILPDWAFQDDIPVRHSELWLYLTPYYEYISLTKGNKRISKEDANIISSTEGGIGSDGGDKTIVTKYFADSLPALKSEEFATTMSDHYSQIDFYLNRFTHRDGRAENFLNDWKALAEKLTYSVSELGAQFNKKSNYSKVWLAVSPELVSATTDDQKIAIIYDYLNRNINWIEGDYSIYADKSLNDAFEKKKANSGELNMMLIACLKEAGVKSYPLLVSTRSHGAPIMAYPIFDQFNHLMCYIDRGEKSVLVDVGNTLRPIGAPRVEALNQAGWVLDEKNPRWINITAPQSTQIVISNLKLNTDGSVKGSFTENYRGYASIARREDELGGEKFKHIKSELSIAYPDIKIDSISSDNLKKMEESYKRSVFFTMPNAATVANNLMYIKPTVKSDLEVNPFKLTSRNYPVDFAYPRKYQFITNLTMPDNYVVDELPKTMLVTLPNDGGTFKYANTVTGNVIQTVMTVNISKTVFQPTDYDALKKFFGQIAAKSTEQIVLKNVSGK